MKRILFIFVALIMSSEAFAETVYYCVTEQIISVTGDDYTPHSSEKFKMALINNFETVTFKGGYLDMFSASVRYAADDGTWWAGKWLKYSYIRSKL